MTWPAQFQERILASVDELALRLAGTPHDRQEEGIQRFADRVRSQWSEIFRPYLGAQNVDEMVANVVARVRAKRDQLESFGGGRA